MIECLQQELVKVRLREAENDALIRDLRSRIHELEEVKYSHKIIESHIKNVFIRKRKLLEKQLPTIESPIYKKN